MGGTSPLSPYNLSSDVHYLHFKNAAATAEGHDYVTSKSDEGFTLPDSILTRSEVMESVAKPNINRKYYEQCNNDYVIYHIQFKDVQCL